MAIEQSSGPIPDPETLAKYAAIDLELVNRIVVMAESEQTHRHKLQKSALASTHFRAHLGQVFGLVITLASLALAAYCARIGEAVAGGVVASINLVGIVSVFVLQRRPKQTPDTENGVALHRVK